VLKRRKEVVRALTILALGEFFDTLLKRMNTTLAPPNILQRTSYLARLGLLNLSLVKIL